MYTHDSSLHIHYPSTNPAGAVNFMLVHSTKHLGIVWGTASLIYSWCLDSRKAPPGIVQYHPEVHFWYTHPLALAYYAMLISKEIKKNRLRKELKLVTADMEYFTRVVQKFHELCPLKNRGVDEIVPSWLKSEYRAEADRLEVRGTSRQTLLLYPRRTAYPPNSED